MIDEARPELHKVLEKINADISVLELRAFVGDDGKVVYHFDGLYEEDEDREIDVAPTQAKSKTGPANRAARRKRKAESDTIVVPAREDGFKEEFLANSCWFSIRIGAAMKNRIRYIAAYRVAPISAVTHLAEVQDIKPYQDTGKYIVHFKGEPQEIRPVPVKDLTRAPQGPVYVRREKLLSAATLEEALTP